jgi:hypothetical protein
MKYPYPDSLYSAKVLLNKVKPGWWTSIKLHKLNMVDGYDDILGQLYGSYGMAFQELFGRAPRPAEQMDGIFGQNTDPAKWEQMIKDLYRNDGYDEGKQDCYDEG